jgi:GH24 family phage-related lysozyme (muramidase)
MTTATVRSAAQHIARAGTITPHQLAALGRLDELLSDAQRQAFTDLWRAEGSPAGLALGLKAEMLWLQPALKIIKEFEGCHLAAYICPAGVPTIGWGTTAGVKLGDTISQARADELLADDVQARYQRLVELLPMVRQWPGNRVAALVSWAYNVGMQAVADSTLRKRLAGGEDPVRVVSEELPKWDKANGKPLAGLTRRRAAEVALFVGRPAVELQQPARVTPSSPFSTRLTPHITLGEFALGQEARRFDHQHQVDTAAELAAFMERCRKQFGGRPVIITSGYRPAAINRSVGGASSSEHLYNAPNVGAVDFNMIGVNVKTLQDWCDANWPYSLGYGAAKGFVHLGIRAGRPRIRWDY